MNRAPVPILTYHQIEAPPPRGTPYRSLVVSPGAFARQMGLLKLLGYTGLSMSAHRTTLFASHSRPSRFVSGETLWRSLPGFRGSLQGDLFQPDAGA